MRQIVTFLILCLGIAAGASADPIRLTSGNIFVVADNNGGSGFSGGFTFSGSGLAAGAGGIGVPTVTTFGPGPLDVSGTFGISPTSSVGSGYVIVGDQELRGILSAAFQFTADPIVVGDSPSGLTTFETQFTASGFVQLFDDLGAARPSFTQAVYGIGDLAVNAENVGNGTFVTRSMGLVFTPDSSPVPTPEPGSLLLLGTGLLAVWQSRRLRGRAHRADIAVD